MPASYIVITPAKNEARFISHTIESMLQQKLRPANWIIVDDASTDETHDLAVLAAKDHPWITVSRRQVNTSRTPGAGVVEVFNHGLSALQGRRADFIVKLDADLSFEPSYFHECLQRFESDRTLGIASGVYLEKWDGRTWTEIPMPWYHAAGACKIIRWECFEAINGFVPSRGWDTVDEIRARACGWSTRHFPELKMKHWKPEGSGIGTMRTCVMHGEIYYLTGGGSVFFVFKLLRRALARPYITGASAMFFGYFRARMKRRSRLVSREEAKLYQRLLNARLFRNRI